MDFLYNSSNQLFLDIYVSAPSPSAPGGGGGILSLENTKLTFFFLFLFHIIFVLDFWHICYCKYIIELYNHKIKNGFLK